MLHELSFFGRAHKRVESWTASSHKDGEYYHFKQKMNFRMHIVRVLSHFLIRIRRVLLSYLIEKNNSGCYLLK